MRGRESPVPPLEQEVYVRPLNLFGELTVTDQETMSTKSYPAYTCGHCSNIVVMNSLRERPRNMCFHCMKYICESRPICNEQCTPLSALADDHFSDKSSHSRLVNGIMAGANSSEEAVKNGLILPF